MKPAILFFLLVGGLSTLPLQAQFWERLINPDVVVTLTHPPGLGIKFKRVAFAPVDSKDAEDLVAACIEDLAGPGGLEVADRGNIEKVIKEQRFANSGLVDAASAVELGKLLGSPLLLFVKVPRMQVKHVPLQNTQPGWTDDKGRYYPAVTTYTSKTQVEFNATVQAVDLATGKIFSQQRFAETPSRQTSSTEGRPEFPSNTEVIELAVHIVRSQVHRMLLPWSEQRKLIFYDDKDYGMKEAFKRLQLKDYEGAFKKSQEALEAAKADPKCKPKYIGRTNYNCGMAKFILGDHREALPFLQAARETDPSHKIFAEAANECERALHLVNEMSRVEAKSAKLELVQRPSEPPPPAPVSTPTKSNGSESVEVRLSRP